MSGAPKVAIVDYGVGNLLSVARAVEHIGGAPRFVTRPDQVASADRLILPGVGAFGDCADAIRADGLDQALRAYIACERPMLGVCVGMQLLFDASEEFGRRPGLGVIAGDVRRLPDQSVDGRPLKTPSIGWKAIRPPSERRWSASLLARITPGDAVYFVHSFAGAPENAEDVLAETDFGGHSVCAAVARGSVMATQFHPEKSGRVGLEILRAFLQI